MSSNGGLIDQLSLNFDKIESYSWDFVYNYIEPEEPMNLLSQGNLANIKSEVLTGQSFADRFISIVENRENESSVSKDSIFQWMKLFDEDNPQFLNLFERSFLLIFKSYTDLGNHIERRSADQAALGYSDLLCMFLCSLIDLTTEVKLNQEKKVNIKNFIEFQLLFFSEGLTAGKVFIKEFSYRIIYSLLKIISEKLEISLQNDTQTQLLDSVIYLLISKQEDSKMMGIQLYGILKKMGIQSAQVHQLSLQYLEQLKIFAVRRLLIRYGVNLNEHGTLDRLMNRLKDKNPLIVQEVVQKLISQNFSLEDMSFEQKIKLLVEGYGSFHANVKSLALAYFKREFIQILKFRGHKLIERRIEEKEVRLQTLNRSLSISLNRSNNTSCLDQKRILVGVQKFIRIFNYDQFQAENTDFFRQNPFSSSLALSLIFQITTNVMPLSQLINEICRIFTELQNYNLESEDCIFLYCLLRGLIKSKDQQKETEELEINKSLRNFLLKSEKVPKHSVFLTCLAKFFEDKGIQNLTIKFFLLKILELLTVDLDFYDCVGKRVIYNQLIKFLTQIEFSEGLFKRFVGDVHIQDNKLKDDFIYLQLMKANHLLNSNSFNESVQSIQLVTAQIDLIFTITEIIHKILGKQPSCQRGEFKLLITELIESKNLKLEKETLLNMRLKTAGDIKTTTTQIKLEALSPKYSSNLVDINSEIDKKLQINQKRIVSRIIKAFFMIVKNLSIKQSNKKQNKYLQDFKASTYYEAVKSYIQNSIDSAEFSICGELQTLWIPYMIFYYTASQSPESFATFKKLFQFYAFGNEGSLCQKDNLLRMLNSRFLFELELMSIDSLKTQESKTQRQKNSTVYKILMNLMNLKINDPIQDQFFKEIILRDFKTMSLVQEKDQVLCHIFLFVIKQFMSDSEIEGVYTKIFLLVFRTMISSHEKDYEKVLLIHSFMDKLIAQQKAIIEEQDKQIIIQQITNVLNTLLNLIHQKRNNQSLTKFNMEILSQMILDLKFNEAMDADIQSRKAELSRQIFNIQIKANKIYDSIASTKFFKSISKDFVIFVAKYKSNNFAELRKRDEIKMEENPEESTTVLHEKIQQINREKVEFDRKGRRKLTDDERMKLVNKVKASVKKSRYVIIPYDLVESAEEKYGKNGGSKKNIRKSSLKTSNDSAYRPWKKERSAFSHQTSNIQTTNPPSSNESSSQQQTTVQNRTYTS